MLAAAYANQPLIYLDYLAAFFVVFFIIIESIADNQQFAFHKLKKGKEKSSSKYALSLQHGFMHEGLWAYSRHPNFAAEQLIWISFYCFGIAASKLWLNWTLSGAVLLVILFIASSRLTENISSSKYPDYKTYQKNVSRFIPLMQKS